MNKNLKKVRLAIELDPKTKPPQVHVPQKNKKLKFLLDPGQKLSKTCLDAPPQGGRIKYQWGNNKKKC